MNKTFMKSLMGSTIIAGSIMGATSVASAQDAEEIVVTGTRIVSPGIVSSSPINTIDSAEFDLQQVIEVEELFRDLPITIPGDGQNVNNGTSGISTLNLRALGTNRTLILMDGKRMTPFDVDGAVDLQSIPANLIERVDIVTGGASAVYGSDAMAGAVNFIMKDDFEGVTIDAKYGQDKNGEARTYNISGLLGGNFGDGAGNAVLSLNHSKRDPLLLGDRDLGLFGISTRNGPSEGGVPASPPANCDAPGTTAFSTGVGSTTSIPTTLNTGFGDFQLLNDGGLTDPEDGTCSRFNFNPFNYYQTPSEKFNMAGLARYDINDSTEAYTSLNFTNVTVRQQVAPSGTFGAQFDLPLQNAFLSQSRRDTLVAAGQQFIIDENNSITEANNTLGNPMDPAFDPAYEIADLIGLEEIGVDDRNMNGIFDDEDYIRTSLRRRTLELGTRSSDYDQNTFRFNAGVRGDLAGSDWNYDVSYQRGQTDVEETRRGYTNLSNIQTSIDTISTTECIAPGTTTAVSTCVPIDLFGPFGSITPDQVSFNTAIAILKKTYQQDVFNASFSGPLEGFKSPFADEVVQSAFGFEYRAEEGETIPDECLLLAPASCQGGAGGNLAPIKAGFDVYELFGEAIIPVASGMNFVEDFSLELGVRGSDYSSTGTSNTWKAGANWSVTPDFRIRVMQQEATRAPNVGELGSPVTTGLSSASLDPCSAGNVDADGNLNPISAELRALCISTGMRSGQVGSIQDVISNQISVFSGTDLANPPQNETADTFTAGFVYRPSFLPALTSPTISVDYYDILIEDYIGTFSAQEILDACYVGADASQCAKINRVNGTLSFSGAGVNLLTTNLDYQQTEGVDVTASAGYDLGEMGELRASTFMAFLMTQESQSTGGLPVIDCLGKYGNDCSPTPEFNANSRLTWLKGPITASVLWRHVGDSEIQDSQRATTFDAFESIDSYNYFDFTGSYDFNEMFTATVGVRNLFDEEPPIVGNGAGSTAFNSGNTFPSTYDILGRTVTFGLRGSF